MATLPSRLPPFAGAFLVCSGVTPRFEAASNPGLRTTVEKQRAGR